MEKIVLIVYSLILIISLYLYPRYLRDAKIILSGKSVDKDDPTFLHRKGYILKQ